MASLLSVPDADPALLRFEGFHALSYYLRPQIGASRSGPAKSIPLNF